MILASNNQIEKEIAGQDFRLIKPSKNITNSTNTKLGLVGTISDSDGFIRRYPIFLPITGDSVLYYTLAIESVLAFNNYKGEKTISLEGKKRLASIGPLNIKTYGKSNMLQINYSGPISSTFNTFPRYPVSNIIDTTNNLGDNYFYHKFSYLPHTDYQEKESYNILIQQ